MINLFPYTDAHELNLDWVVEQVKANNTKVKDITHTVENLHFDFDQKADKATTYTKTEVDTLLLGKANVSDIPDMSNYYDKSETDTLLASKADVSDLPDMTDYYDKTTTDNLLTDKADKATTLAGYGIENAYTKTQVDGLITPIVQNALANPDYTSSSLYFAQYGRMVIVSGRITLSDEKPAGQSNYIFRSLPVPAGTIASVNSDTNYSVIINSNGYLTSNLAIPAMTLNLTCAYISS